MERLLADTLSHFIDVHCLDQHLVDLFDTVWVKLHT